MDWLLRTALRAIVKQGNLRVTTASGATIIVGDGSGKFVRARFSTSAAQIGVVLDPELRLGEAYMNGTFAVDEGSIADFLEIVMAQTPVLHPSKWTLPHRAFRYAVRRLIAIQLARQIDGQRCASL